MNLQQSNMMLILKKFKAIGGDGRMKIRGVG